MMHYDADIVNNDVDIGLKPSYESRGSVSIFDVYMISWFHNSKEHSRGLRASGVCGGCLDWIG